MGWRERMQRLRVVPEALLDMPAADRIALARELLAGTGYGAAILPDVWDANACRAAMMGGE